MPTYLDGEYNVYNICQTDDLRPKEYLQKTNISGFFEELSISDTIKFANESRIQKIIKKIRVAQDKSINSLCVLFIDNKYYKVFNAYHFINNDGIPQSDISLEEYKNPIFEGDINGR